LTSAFAPLGLIVAELHSKLTTSEQQPSVDQTKPESASMLPGSLQVQLARGGKIKSNVDETELIIEIVAAGHQHALPKPVHAANTSRILHAFP
jgi:hypothetical protein